MSFLKKHWPEWKQTIVVIATILGMGYVGRGVDVWRLPAAVKLQDQKNAIQSEGLAASLQTNSVKLDCLSFDLKSFRAESKADNSILKTNQKKVIELFDLYITNHPPVHWNDYSAQLHRMTTE
jgi:hypothetical protein